MRRSQTVWTAYKLLEVEGEILPRTPWESAIFWAKTAQSHLRLLQNLVVLENNNEHLTQLSAEKLPLSLPLHE